MKLFNLMRPYLFLGCIILLMVGITINFTIKENNNQYKLTAGEKDLVYKLEKSDKSPMDTTLLLLILSTVGILAGIWSNPKMKKLEENQKDLSIKLDDYQIENRNQHKELKEDVKKVTVKADLETSLREIVEGVLETTSGDLSSFILFEGGLFINFAKEVSNGSFCPSALPSVRIKLNQIKEESVDRANWLGERFAKEHSNSQIRCVDKLYNGIEETLMDEMFNTKHKRFKMLCEQFLQTHLTDSVRSYLYLRSN
jgi:hypothetical protein